MKKQIKRQAVIIIHGIGEQRPIESLRNFVEAISNQLKKNKKVQEEKTIFWDKPDPSSGNYETRKIIMNGGRDCPITEFYEFYWAHHMRETKWLHIKNWLFSVVFRRHKNVSKRLQPIWFFMWILLVTLLSAIVIYLIMSGINAFSTMIKAFSGGIIGTGIIATISYYLFNFLGDAGRYLDPTPENIAERQAIREEGVKLLKNLHESGKYDRIVVIGHSLGSVIGYDLIRLLWNEYYKSFDNEKFHLLIQGANKQILRDITCSEDAGKQLDRTNKTLKAFQDAQTKSYEYLKAIGNKWLITDFLTIGSPLAHAGHLFAHKKELFEKLKEQREYPTCPPIIHDSNKTNILPANKINIDGLPHPLSIRLFNHSSPFAVTKWTNIYYDLDFIGGPLKDRYGIGIRDIRVKSKNLLCHTKYWDFKKKYNILNRLCDILRR
jgi:hypothetical protein